MESPMVWKYVLRALRALCAIGPGMVAALDHVLALDVWEGESTRLADLKTLREVVVVLERGFGMDGFALQSCDLLTYDERPPTTDSDRGARQSDSDTDMVSPKDPEDNNGVDGEGDKDVVMIDP